MLTLLADQPECLWDDALPMEVRQLPADLAALDVLLSDSVVLWPSDGSNLSQRGHRDQRRRCGRDSITPVARSRFEPRYVFVPRLRGGPQTP